MLIHYFQYAHMHQAVLIMYKYSLWNIETETSKVDQVEHHVWIKGKCQTINKPHRSIIKTPQFPAEKLMKNV